MPALRTRAYLGSRHDQSVGPCAVIVRDSGKASRKLSPRLDLYNHSPDGFQWGYGGSGPAQLALALAADALGDDQLALRHHQRLKNDRIAKIWQHHWELSAGEIQDLYAGYEAEEAKA